AFRPEGCPLRLGWNSVCGLNPVYALQEFLVYEGGTEETHARILRNADKIVSILTARLYCFVQLLLCWFQRWGRKSTVKHNRGSNVLLGYLCRELKFGVDANK